MCHSSEIATRTDISGLRKRQYSSKVTTNGVPGRRHGEITIHAHPPLVLRH